MSSSADRRRRPAGDGRAESSPESERRSWGGSGAPRTPREPAPASPRRRPALGRPPVPSGRTGRHRPGPVLVGCGLVAVLLAACDLSPTARVTTRPPAPTPEAPVWSGSTGVLASPGGTGALVVVADPASIVRGVANGNLRPLWLLYRVSSSGAADLTPIGETTRGGLVVAHGAGSAIWVGVGSYRYQLDGTVAETSDGGRHWRREILPGLLDPRPGALFAWNAEEAVAVVEPLGAKAYDRSPREQEILETEDGGAKWTTILSARAAGRLLPAGCTVAGLAGTSAGRLWVGTRCRVGWGRLLEGASVGGRWQWREEVVTVGPSGGAPPGGVVEVVPPGAFVSGVRTAGGSSLVDLGAVVTTSATGSAVALYRARGGTVTPSGPILESAGRRPPALAAGSGGVAALVGAGGPVPTLRWLTPGSSTWSRPVPVEGGRPVAFFVTGAGSDRGGVGRLWFAGVDGRTPAAWTAESAVPPTGPIVLHAVGLPLPETSAQLPGAGS